MLHLFREDSLARTRWPRQPYLQALPKLAQSEANQFLADSQSLCKDVSSSTAETVLSAGRQVGMTGCWFLLKGLRLQEQKTWHVLLLPACKWRACIHLSIGSSAYHYHALIMACEVLDCSNEDIEALSRSRDRLQTCRQLCGRYCKVSADRPCQTTVVPQEVVWHISVCHCS